MRNLALAESDVSVRGCPELFYNAIHFLTAHTGKASQCAKRHGIDHCGIHLIGNCFRSGFRSTGAHACEDLIRKLLCDFFRTRVTAEFPERCVFVYMKRKYTCSLKRDLCQKPDITGGRSNLDLIAAACCIPVAKIGAVPCEAAVIKLYGNCFCLAGLQRDFFEALQFFERPFCTSGQIRM